MVSSHIKIVSHETGKIQFSKNSSIVQHESAKV